MRRFSVWALAACLSLAAAQVAQAEQFRSPFEDSSKSESRPERPEVSEGHEIDRWPWPPAEGEKICVERWFGPHLVGSWPGRWTSVRLKEKGYWRALRLRAPIDFRAHLLQRQNRLEQAAQELEGCAAILDADRIEGQAAL